MYITFIARLTYIMFSLAITYFGYTNLLIADMF